MAVKGKVPTLYLQSLLEVYSISQFVVLQYSRLPLKCGGKMHLSAIGVIWIFIC